MTTPTKTDAYRIDPELFRKLTDLVDEFDEASLAELGRRVAKQIAEQTGIAEKVVIPAIAALFEFAMEHHSIDTPELEAELRQKIEAAGMGIPRPRPALFGTALYAGIKIENHGTSERPLFRLEDVATLVKMPAEEIRKSLDARDEIEFQRCELTGSDEFFVTEPGLYQSLMWSEVPIAEAFKRRVVGVLNNNPELTKKAQELWSEIEADSRKPRA